MNRLTFFVFIILGAASTVCSGGWAVKTAVAVKTAKPPVIDGRIDHGEWPPEDLWQGAFVACPGDAPARQQTCFTIMFDKQNIYIAAKCNEIHINKIKTYTKNEIDIWRHDSLEFFIQRNENRKQYQQFLVSVGGGRFGLKFITSVMRGKQQIPLNTWQAAAKTNNRDYVIEAKIPFKLFNAKPANGMEWRLNIQRNATTLDSDRYSTWSPVSKFQNPADFGYLLFAFSDSNMLQRRIVLKRRFNMLKSQVEGFHRKYVKFDPSFAANINSELKREDWDSFKQQGLKIMNMNAKQLDAFDGKLSVYTACLLRMKQSCAKYLLKKFFR